MFLLSTTGSLTNLDVMESIRVAQDPTSQKWAIKGRCCNTLDIQEYKDEVSARAEMALVVDALGKPKVPMVFKLKGGDA